MTGGKIPGVFKKVAKKRGDRRPGSLKAEAPPKIARSAAQKRLGLLHYTNKPGLRNTQKRKSVSQFVPNNLK